MAPTSLEGQVTQTSPYGRDVKACGFPIRVCEMLATLEGPEYLERVTVNSVKAVKNAKKAIKKAIENGVKVEIMIPGKSDIKFTPDAVMYTANKLRKKGADIYVFNGGFHHSKIMMIDSLYCTVGSTNLNSRSLRYDYEVNAFIFDKETTTELIDIFEEDKTQSNLLTREMYKERGLFKRFIGWFAHLFTPFL
jgi:cardiolipin synthase